MSEALQVVSALCGLALPFILYILYGLAADVRELRGKLDPLVTSQAVATAEMRIVKKQLNLMDEQTA